MSFIKLNQQKLNYQQQEKQSDDTFILSDIVDSTISPEYPKIIRTTDELAIYFGTNWDQYDYYVQLLSSGISLLLYKPLLGNQEIDSYEIKTLDGFPDNPEEGILYSIGNDRYYIYNKDTDTFIDYDDLPENSGSPENSPSWKNRDSLGLSRDGIASNYIPDFSDEEELPEEEHIFNFLEKSEVKQSIENYGDLDDNVTFSFLLDFSNVDTKEWLNLEEDVYIVFIKAISKINNRFDIFWVNNHYWDDVSIIDKLIPRTLLDNQAPLFYFHNYSKSQVLEDISQILSSELGYNTELQGETIIVRSSELLRVNSFSNIPGLVITSMESYSNQVIEWGLQESTTKDKPNYYKVSQNGDKIYYKYLPSNYLEFYSRLLGKSLDPITITVKKVNNETYQIVVSKLNYSELYYGRLDFDIIDGEIRNLEADINKNSKLVYCKLHNCYSVEDDSLVISSIPEGTWQLSGGKIETIIPRNRWNGLRALEGINVQEDFLLISDIQKWRYYGIGDSSYYQEYESLLNYAITKNCQILIQNNPIVQIKSLQSKGVTYRLGDKILNGEKGEINKITNLSSQSIDYSNMKLTSNKPLEVSIDSKLLKDIKESGIVFSGKDYNISKIRINDDIIVDSNIAVSQESNFSLESDNFSNLKVGDRITIETTQTTETTEGTLSTNSGKILKSKEITGFKVGDTLFNKSGNQLLEKVSEENQQVGVVKINNNFYKVSEDNTVSEVDTLKANDTLIELEKSANKLIQISEGYIVNSSGIVVSENTRNINFSSEGDKLYSIEEKIIDNSGKIISDKFQILSTKKESNKPTIYSLSGKYYNASTQNEVNEKEYALPWGNDFFFNYTGDLENRLIYFFKDFQIDGLYKRPGYYYFLRGILFNNWEIDKVIYDHDEEVEMTELGEQLQLKKSNYISLYNNSYHYKKFFWDTTGNQDYYCSGTLKYCQSRISRLFEKYKWKLLGFQKEGEMQSYVENILNSIREKNSSLVYSLTLEDLKINNNKAEIRLLLRTKEFIEKDIKLNITLNYIY